MHNKKFRFGTLLVIMAAMTFSMTSCEYMVNVDFKIAHNGNDTLVLKGWDGANEVCYTSPYASNSGDVFGKTTISSFRAGGGSSTIVTEEQAFTQLMSDYDSVRITRRSDNASTITYRHDENASDAQRYFFTREAWQCDPEGEELKSRTYTFILKDEMFK
jgi:hypothetical protein